jgi:23S rRNA (uridine2552-2'-O)-methyltransferase
MAYVPQDKFAKLAKKQGYRARSAYKLLDMQGKFKLIKKGDYVLDLGAAPGSWMQVASEIVGEKGRVVGVDITPIKSLDSPNTKVFQKSIQDEDFTEFLQKHGYKEFDSVISDIAPNTTGIKERDQALSYELCGMALEVAYAVLRNKGNVVMKIFEGPDTVKLLKQLQKRFSRVHLVKPMGSTKGSKESFLVATGYSQIDK